MFFLYLSLGGMLLIFLDGDWQRGVLLGVGDFHDGMQAKVCFYFTEINPFLVYFSYSCIVW